MTLQPWFYIDSALWSASRIHPHCTSGPVYPTQDAYPAETPQLPSSEWRERWRVFARGPNRPIKRIKRAAEHSHTYCPNLLKRRGDLRPHTRLRAPTFRVCVASVSIPRELNRCWYFNHKPRILSMVQTASSSYRVDLGVSRDYSRWLSMGYQEDQQEAAGRPRDLLYACR